MSEPAESDAFKDFLSTLDEEGRYRARERVAIMVFDGGATRDQAAAYVMDHPDYK